MARKRASKSNTRGMAELGERDRAQAPKPNTKTRKASAYPPNAITPSTLLLPLKLSAPTKMTERKLKAASQSRRDAALRTPGPK